MWSVAAGIARAVGTEAGVFICGAVVCMCNRWASCKTTCQLMGVPCNVMVATNATHLKPVERWALAQSLPSWRVVNSGMAHRGARLESYACVAATLFAYSLLAAGWDWLRRRCVFDVTRNRAGRRPCLVPLLGLAVTTGQVQVLVLVLVPGNHGKRPRLSLSSPQTVCLRRVRWGLHSWPRW